MGLDSPATLPAVFVSGVEVEPPCNCPVSIVIMRELGLTHAAAMHGDDSGTPGVRDVELHMRDEEDGLFPVLRRVANGLDAIGSTSIASARASKLRRDVHTLEVQHGHIRKEYLANGMVPPASVLGPHGKAEDAIITEFADLIRVEAERIRGA